MSVLPKSVIESKAINALERLIDDTHLLDHAFNSRDKEPLWDGDILLYRNVEGNYENRHLEARIPVQIKGHEDKSGEKIQREHIRQPVKLEDLRAYYNDKGVLYFHVYLRGNNEYAIFYASMHPIFIKHYLDKASRNGNKKTIQVSFHRLNPTPDTILAVVKLFYGNVSTQGPGNGQLVPKAIKVDDISHHQDIRFTAYSNQTIQDLLQHFVNGDICFYSPIQNTGILLPYEHEELTAASMSMQMHKDVCVSGKTFYSSFWVQEESGGTTIIKLSDSFTITLLRKNQEVQFALKPESCISDFAHDIQFLMNISAVGVFEIEGEEINCHGLKLTDENERNFSFVVKADKALKRIGFSCDKTYKELTPDNLQQLRKLVELFEGTTREDIESEVTVYSWSFDERYVSFLLVNDESGIDALPLFHQDKYYFFTTDDNNDRYPVPIFSCMEPTILAKQYEAPTGAIRVEIENETVAPATVEHLMYAGLVLINAYDCCLDNCYLELARLQFDRIRPLADKTILLINDCQISARQGKLNAREKSALRKVIKDSALAAFGAYVLLGEKANADAAFSALEADVQKQYEAYPIYTLYRNLSQTPS